MKTLRFIVSKQIIEPDPNCDFSGLVPGTDGYLRAEFNFSSDWNGFTKVVAFRSRMGKEYEPQLLKEDNTCIIPTEALKRRIFSIQVIGKKNDDTKLVTNKTVVHQNGGKK